MAEVEVEKEVRMVLDRIVDALNSADAVALASLLADLPGSMHIGSDPYEWWSKDQLVHGIEEAMAAGGTQVRAELTETTVHSRGDVAWTEGRGRFINGDGQECDVRLTGVFVRDEEGWRAAQSHTSIGVNNADMFGS